MSCLQDCCEQEPDPTIDQSALAPTCRADVELPEPPELAMSDESDVNGLEAMSFVNVASVTMSDSNSGAVGEPKGFGQPTKRSCVASLFGSPCAEAEVCGGRTPSTFPEHL